MKTLLDEPKSVGQLDSFGVYQSLKSFGSQFESGWHESQFVSLSFEIDDIEKIVFAGMGGSNLPAHLLLSLSPLLLKTPFEIVANYRLPQYVDAKTLVILASYSGNTEETLSCAQDALKRHCPVVVITTGGKIAELALNEHWPLIRLDDKLNHSHVPRYGLGLLSGAVLSLVSRLNQESFRHLDPKEIVHTFDRTFAPLALEINTTDNPAKQIAIKNQRQSLIIFSANHLAGVGKIAANFLNETGKLFSTNFTFPDLNHHLLEGLTFPTSFKDNSRFLLLDSSLYPEVIQKRLGVTKDVLIKQHYQLTVIKPESTNIVSQVFESLVFLVMISYYLSIVNKQDPGTNPWVDYFKKQL